jgi:hypothetical protein
MKLTKSKLKQLIKEELKAVMNEQYDAKYRMGSGGYNYSSNVVRNFAKAGITKKLVSAAFNALKKNKYDMMYDGQMVKTAPIIFKAAVADWKNPLYRKLIYEKAPPMKAALKRALKPTTAAAKFLLKAKAFVKGLAKKAPVIGGIVGITTLLLATADAYASDGAEAAGKVLAKDAARVIPEVDMMVGIFELAEEYFGVSRTWRDNVEHEMNRVRRGTGTGFQGHRTME